ncbi:MAG: SDR family oxidoreductase [Bacteroidales bacterium]|jgi:acetoacetyl-CoA reductase/3-oxoacyl-[acyl-carrier protein] reductase|nr:SDR family oxidoreductase [Bacteroidales bacterium]
MKVLITGASKGIGSYLFEKFYRDGQEVYGTYNSTTPNFKEGNFSKVNIVNDDDVKNWVEEVVKHGDKIVLINCAGVNYNAIAHKADKEKWKRVIEVNLIGTFNVIYALLPFMRECNYGRIINFSSVVPQKGIPGTSAYAASKAGLWGLTKSIAAENAKKGITINSLNIGYFNIGMSSEIPEEFLSGIISMIPMHKLGDPENIYNAVNFLINADYVNGTSVDINGGLV